jgi:hypothetical protein
MNTRVSHFYGVGISVEINRINMTLQMSIAKKSDGLSLRNLLNVLKALDKSNEGVLDTEFFEKGLR